MADEKAQETKETQAVAPVPDLVTVGYTILINQIRSIVGLVRTYDGINEDTGVSVSFITKDAEHITLLNRTPNKEMVAVTTTASEIKSLEAVLKLVNQNVIRFFFNELKAVAVMKVTPVLTKWDDKNVWTLLVTWATKDCQYSVQYLYDEETDELYPNTDFDLAGRKEDLTSPVRLSLAQTLFVDGLPIERTSLSEDVDDALGFFPQYGEFLDMYLPRVFRTEGMTETVLKNVLKG